MGTQLAERGARTRTIMAIMGHSTASMSMIYAHISDKEVLHDYQAVLGPGASIAGPFAESLRQGRLSQQELDWLQTNFLKVKWDTVYGSHKRACVNVICISPAPSS